MKRVRSHVHVDRTSTSIANPLKIRFAILDLLLVLVLMDPAALALPFATTIYNKGPYDLYGAPKVRVKNSNHFA